MVAPQFKAQLSARTFCTFAREFSSNRRRLIGTHSDSVPEPAGFCRSTDAASASPFCGLRPRMYNQWRFGRLSNGRSAVQSHWALRSQWTYLARRRSVGFNTCPARGGSPRPQVFRHRFPRAEVHLVRRLSLKRRMRKHAIVLLDVEPNQSTHRGNPIERVQEEPLMFQGAPPCFDHGVRELQLSEGQDATQHSSGDHLATWAFTFSTPASANTTGVVSEGVAPRLASNSTTTVFTGANVSATRHAKMRREKLSMTAWR